MKLLYITDTHFRYHSPRSRTDSFFDTLVKKMEEIGKIIKQEKVTALLHGGDLFDRPDAQIAVAGKFASILMSYNVPIYIISGNHDSFGQNPSTIERSMLGLLSSLRVVHLLDNKSVSLNENNLRVEIHGTPYSFDLDRDPKNYLYKRDPNADYSIQLVHGFLINRPFMKGINYTLIDDIVDTEADLVLAGHYHSGYPTTVKKGTTFINPGSIARMTNTQLERSRIPKAILIELQKSGNTVTKEITEIPLLSAKPGDHVMVDKTPNHYEVRIEALKAFKTLIYSKSDTEETNLVIALMTMAKNANLDVNLIKEAQERLDRAMKVASYDNQI